MAARYYVHVSQELLDAEPPPPWEGAGLHLVEVGGFTEPGSRWCLFADDNAPEELNGKKVELALTRGPVHEEDPFTDAVWVSERRVIE
jgi:hypothetical protein